MIKEETDAEEFRERIQVEQGDFIVFHRLSETKSCLAKSEALDNIYSLFKQNIKSCDTKQRKHAMRENSEKQQ